MARVVLIDDHSLVRAGIRGLVNSQPGFEVVAEGCDGSDAERLIEQFKPDILLLDISMKQQGGLDTLHMLRKTYPRLKVLMLSMHVAREYVMKALNFGANGYLVKDAAIEELGLALEAMMQGRSYLSPEISHAVIQCATDEVLMAEPVQPSALTARQNEVLRLLARGCSTRDMAKGLNLSVKTVEAHRAQIMERLQVRDVPSLVRYAIRSGLVTLDE